MKRVIKNFCLILAVLTVAVASVLTFDFINNKSSVNADEINTSQIEKSVLSDTPNYLTFTAKTAGATITFNYTSGSDVMSSIDGGTTWVACPSGTSFTLTNINDTLKLKGTNVCINTSSTSNPGFVMSGTIEGSGDVTSLTNGVGGDCALSAYCYKCMFYHCTSLITAPNVPSTTLAESCYRNMFRDTSITTAPELPSTGTAVYCYGFMFQDTKLTTLPKLQAHGLANNCYYKMFLGCTDLCVYADNTHAGYQSQWQLPYAVSIDTNYPNGNSGDMFTGCTNVCFGTVPTAGTIYYQLGSAPTANYLTLTAKEANSTIQFNYASGTNVESSVDGGTTWVACPSGTSFTLTNVNDTLKLRGIAVAINTNDTTNPGFVMTGTIEASGDVTSLTNGVGGDCYLNDFCYKYLFKECVSLTKAPNLPSTILANSCYRTMFYNCTNLTLAPALPATSMAQSCYRAMFSGCSNLTNVPNLPTTALANESYYNMFYGCTSLTAVGNISLTNSGNSGCCQMFYGCTGLISVGNISIGGSSEYTCKFMFYGCTGLISVSNIYISSGREGCFKMFYNCTSLSSIASMVIESTGLQGCYEMFYGCTSLANIGNSTMTISGFTGGSRAFYGCTSLLTAPQLPATTLAQSCYYSMFSGCTSLITAPTLPATTLAQYCYSSMFEKCTSLITAPTLPATTLAESCYNSMFEKCSSLATAPTLPATTLARLCYYSMFYGCGSLVNAPQLPATTLAEYCYCFMFTLCTSLVNAPQLPATTLAQYCYSSMFSQCTSLTTAPKLPATTLATGCYYQMFSQCTSLTTAPKLPATTLANSCYEDMFSNCTSLVTIPNLPAITLVARCYYRMFYYCTSLKLYTDDTHEGYTTPWSLSADLVTASEWNNQMFDCCANVCCRTSGPVAGTVYYQLTKRDLSDRINDQGIANPLANEIMYRLSADAENLPTTSINGVKSIDSVTVGGVTWYCMELDCAVDSKDLYNKFAKLDLSEYDFVEVVFCRHYAVSKMESFTSLPLFTGCDKLETINIPAGMKTIPAECFKDCSSLESLDLPASITEIGANAFKNSGLVTLTIRSNQATIDSTAMEDCEDLSDIYYYGTSGEWVESGADEPEGTTVHYMVTSGAGVHYDRRIYLWVASIVVVLGTSFIIFAKKKEENICKC